MRGRFFVAKLGLLAGSLPAFAQSPPLPQPPSFPQPPMFPQTPPVQPTYPGPLAPSFPQPPRPLPPGLTSGSFTPAAPSANPVARPQEIALPQKENKFAISATDISLKRVTGAWQLWAGQKLLRDFGNDEMSARDAADVYRNLRPTEWVTIGSPRPIVEYGLVNGRPSMTAPVPGAPTDPRLDVFQAGGSKFPAVSTAGAKAIVPIDLKSVRVEAVRGVWCLRDDANIHFNFGPNKADAEQAHAVVLRYGFNRIGVVGAPVPVMNYLFASNDQANVPNLGAFSKVALQSQIDALTRVGIPVPGVGYVGEMFKFDPRRLEARKDGSEWLIVSGTELLGRYGPSEYAARDALRTIQEARFNEFCTVGSAGLTFFLVDGKAPTRVPFHVHGRRFDPNSLKVNQTGGKWAVTENSRHLLDCASVEEGETLIRVLKHFQFDQLCHLGPTPKHGVSFLAKGK